MRDDEEPELEGPSPDKTVVGWVKEHPIQAATAAVVVIASLRVAIVASFQPESMASLLQHTSFTVIGGTVAVLATVLLVGVAFAAVPPYAERRGWFPVNSPWPTVVYLFALLVVSLAIVSASGPLEGPWIEGTRHRSSPWTVFAVGLFLAALICAVRSEPLRDKAKEMSSSERWISSILSLFMLPLLAAAVVGIGIAVEIHEPWQLREVITYSGGQVDG